MFCDSLTHAEPSNKRSLSSLFLMILYLKGKHCLRLSDDRWEQPNTGSYETHMHVFVLTNVFESYPINDMRVTFDQVGNVELLRSIDTRDGVYTVALPRATTLTTASKRHRGMCGSKHPDADPLTMLHLFIKCNS